MRFGVLTTFELRGNAENKFIVNRIKNRRVLTQCQKLGDSAAKKKKGRNNRNKHKNPIECLHRKVAHIKNRLKAIRLHHAALVYT